MTIKEKIILTLARHYCIGEYNEQYQGCTFSIQCVKNCGKFDEVAQKIIEEIRKEDDEDACRIRCSD